MGEEANKKAVAGFPDTAFYFLLMILTLQHPGGVK